MAVNLKRLSVPMTEVTGTMSLAVDVTGLRMWKARMWLGLQFLKLAAYTIGCRIEINQ